MPYFHKSQLILLVEDDADTSRGLCEFLKQTDYDVRVAGTADEALELAERYAFDVVISDIALPGRTGFEMMKQLHDRFGLRGIALTRTHSSDIADELADSGFVEHLMKPVDIELLQGAVERVISETRTLETVSDFFG